MLSIIVPVYNTENYLKKCIDSILAQTYTDFELILVDDGSNDQSSSICDGYASKDIRVRVIHKANGGVSSARNAGLDICQGEYVMFVDSDDWIESNFISSFFLEGMDQADVIIGGYTELRTDGKMIHSPRTERLKREEFGQRFEILYSNNFINAPFSKLYKLSTIATKRFDQGVALGEDFLFNLKVFRSCKRFMTI